MTNDLDRPTRNQFHRHDSTAAPLPGYAGNDGRSASASRPHRHQRAGSRRKSDCSSVRCYHGPIRSSCRRPAGGVVSDRPRATWGMSGTLYRLLFCAPQFQLHFQRLRLRRSDTCPRPIRFQEVFQNEKTDIVLLIFRLNPHNSAAARRDYELYSCCAPVALNEIAYFHNYVLSLHAGWELYPDGSASRQPSETLLLAIGHNRSIAPPMRSQDQVQVPSRTGSFC